MFGMTRRGLMGSPMDGSYGMSYAGSGPGNPGLDNIDSSGGMDVLGELRAHGNYGTRFQSNPTGGMSLGPFGMSSPFSTGGMNYGGH